MREKRKIIGKKRKRAQKNAKNSENPLDNLPILCYTIKR
uniref:Uncharacterized protein n=1 Tax=Siphoviridae sp. ctPyh10 TaxID=2827865 RepID=A0A8S5SZ82_9CAUD|nr:MAG TPA: hypothetical protein [Siphoviridae sp. ctPyh10]